MVGRAAPLAHALAALAALAMAAPAAAAPATPWSVDGGCRDGRPQGPYQLRSGDGQLRIAGAFNEGMRTGSFIFWRANGVREAHVPYDNGVRNGTVATWYEGPPGREPVRHFESAWRHGRRDGETRSWYPDGHRRSQTQYASGRIVSALAWTQAGDALPEPAARELAARDAQAADAEYSARDALIGLHLPQCANAARGRTIATHHGPTGHRRDRDGGWVRGAQRA